jgi:hypothetical protein
MKKINKSLQFNLGGVNDSTALNNHNESKSDRRKRLARERYAAVSPGKRAMINKRRRDAATAKRILKTPEEIKEKAKQRKRDYKNRMKEHRANNLHPDSIAMANPQWKPELLSPLGAKPSSRVSKEMVIPEFGGNPVYVEVEVWEPQQQDETSETFLSNTIHTTHLTPGLRESRRKRRNQEFESTIGRNTFGTTIDNQNIASHPTQSCVVDNGKLLANLYIMPVTDKLIHI